MNLKLSDFDSNKDLAKGGISEGGRHKAAVSYAASLFNGGMDFNTAKFEMERWNNTNHPPLPEKELMRIITDAEMFSKRKGGS